MVKDQQLFQAIREEAETAYTTDPRTGKRILDVQKVVALPLLQSVYTEALRLHVSFNISREVVKPLEMSGYTLPVNSLLQAPSRIAHYNESVWGVDGHPASEFWAYRNIKFVEQVDVETGGMKRAMQFEVRGRPTDFFPFGMFLLVHLNRIIGYLSVCQILTRPCYDTRRRNSHLSRPKLCQAGNHVDHRDACDEIRHGVCRVGKNGWDAV